MNIYTTMKRTLHLKVTALTVVFSLVISSLLPAGSHAAAVIPYAHLTPPSRLGTVVHASLGKQAASDAPQVVLIEDLHFNYSVQKNIAGLLEFLADKKILGSAVAVEGAVGAIDNSPLTVVQNKELRNDIAEFLLKNGELTGPQFYSVMSNQPAMLKGVEDPAFYQTNRSIFRESYVARRRARVNFETVLFRLNDLLRATGSKPVLAIEERKERFESGRLSPQDFWNYLKPRADRYGVAQPAALQAYLNAPASLQADMLLSSNLTASLSDYAVALQSHLAKTQQERLIVEVRQRFALASQALAQHCTLADIQRVSRQLEHMPQLLQLLGDASLGQKEVRDAADALRASIDFYVAALMRNRPLLDNTLALQTQQPAQSTVLVVGGFHTEQLVQDLQSRGISYVVYAPQVDSATAFDEALYEQRFLGQRLSAWEAAEWLSSNNGTRGSPSTPRAAGFVPRLQSLAWLSGCGKAAEVDGSISGKDSRARKYRRENGALKMRPSGIETRDVVLTKEDLETLPKDAFKDIPGGEALRAVLGIFKDFKENTPFPEGTNLSSMFPFERLHFISGDAVTFEDDHLEGFKLSLPPAVRAEYVHVRSLRNGIKPPFEAIIHMDAITQNPVFQANPFKFWLMFYIHETAEYGYNLNEQLLTNAGIDAFMDPTLSVTDMLRKSARFIPAVNRYFVYNYGRRAQIKWHELLFDYVLEKARQGVTVALDTLQPEIKNAADPSQDDPGDVARITAFARRAKLLPGVDFRLPRFSEIPELVKSRIPKSDVDEAIRMQLEGRVVEQYYAGGDASRMRDGLKKMGLWDELTEDQKHAMWFLPPGLFFGEHDDSIHLGARAMIRLNQSIRRLAKKHITLGISPEQALANQHIIIHANDRTYESIVRDFQEHHFYGFQPENVYFIVSPTFHNLIQSEEYGGAYVQKRVVVVNPSTQEPEDVTQSVYGHGVATELLVAPTGALRSIQGELRPLETSVLRHIQSVVSQRYHGMILLRQHRVNDLKMLNKDSVDPHRLAYAKHRVESGEKLLFEMVENPPLIEKEGDAPKLQKGGFPLLVLKPTPHFQFPDGISLRDKESASMIARQTAENNDPPILNLMGGFVELGAYIHSLESGIPVNYESKILKDGTFTVLPQYVTGDASIIPGLKTGVYYEKGAVLEDLKSTSYSYLLRAHEKYEAMKQDGEFMQLARTLGFSTPAAGLRPIQVHWFAGITSALVAIAAGLAVMLQNPAALFIVAPWAVSAAAQEYAVVKQAIVSRDPSVLNAHHAIAHYDFGTQRIVGALSLPARAEEMAHAMTQSSSEIVTRVVAPLALALTLLDQIIAWLLGFINRVFAKIPSPDSLQVADRLAENAQQIEVLLADAVPQLPSASTVWQRLGTGINAVWGNSKTRREVEELRARRMIAAAA